LKKHILFFVALFFVFISVKTFGQGPTCSTATPLCSSTPVTFPAIIGGTVPAGNNYGCLGSQPNPSWFTLTVGTGGTVSINQTGPCDQDYAVWGPFNTLSAACAGLTAAPISCSFTTAPNNAFTLTGTPGQIFIMLLTNFGGCTGNVSISEAAGGGSLSCVPVCGVTASNLGPYCSGTTITLNATAANGATAYTWTGPNGFTGTGQNVTIPNCNATMAGVYTVTATGAATCTGSTTVVVNPTPVINPSSNSPVCVGSPLSFTSGAPVGALVAWTGPGLTTLASNPTIASAQLTNTGNFTVTVLQNGCQSQQIVPVVVNPAPTFTPVSPITICSGATVPAQTFTGTPAAATFTWTNNQTSIGLAASGNGGLPSFTATNNSANAVTATISVVPHLGTCNGAASNFNIIVNPAPTITPPTPGVFCEGATVPAITWTTSSPTTTVAWANNNTATGLGASGTGTIPSFIASQVTNQTISTITATPTQGACVGTPITFNLTVNNAPSATITDIGPLCSNVGFQTLVAATPGGVWSGPGIINTSSGLFNPLTAGAGTLTITYTLNLPNQCPASDNTQIQIISVPIVNAGLNQSVCQGQTLNLNGSFTNSNTGNETFAWTPTTNLTGTTTLTPTYTANSTQTYILTVSSGICSATDNVTITMLPQSNATINAAGPYCADVAPVVLTAAQTGGTWSGPGITNATTGAFNPALANVGNNTITYSIGGSCPSTDTQVIVVYAVPNGAITPSGPYCQSVLPVTLTAATPGGTWSGTGINNATTGSFGSTTLAANTYAITYTTSGNCPRTFNQNIVVNASTNATINAAGPYCADVAPVVLTAAQAGGTWVGPGITNATTGAFNPANANIGNNTITYSIGGPCPSTDTQVIIVYDVPDGTITPVGPFCQSSLPVTLTAASTGGTWSGTGINNASTGSFGSATLAANTYTVTYNTGGNCPQNFTQTIVVNANTNATISPAGPYCADDPAVVLTAAQTGGVWGGPGITNTATGAFNPANANTGSNTITYSIGGPCPSTDTQVIVVNSLPNGTITPAGPFCQSDLPFTLTAASAGGTWSGTGINNASTGSFGSATLAANTYTVTYNTGGNCPQIFTQNIVVNANTNATISAAGPYCSDVAPVVLTAAQTGGTWSGTGITGAATGTFNPASANIGNNTITYSIGGPCPSSDTQVILIYDVPDGTITPAGPFCQSDLPFTLTAASAGGTWSGTGINNASTGSFGSVTLAASTYTVTYNTGGNCPQIFTQNIVVNANTNATISAAGPYCSDVAPVVLTAAQTGGTWSGTGITGAATGTFNPASANIGNNTITYSIGGPCPSSDTQVILIYDVPDGTITPAGPFCQSDLPFTLTAASAGGTWSGTGINNASTGSFGSATLAASTYTVTYNTGGNCPNNFTETIVVNANVDATIVAQADLCADAAPVNFTAAQTGGTWSGTGITNASTGAFDPASVIPGTQTITYSIGGACPDLDTQTIEVYPVYDGTITPAGPFCQAVLPITLNAASTGGTWSGSGINNATTGDFGSTSLAGGTYTITYTTAGSCPRVFNETIIVNANVDATISNVAPLCADVAAFNLTAVDPGGTWSGTGITDPVNGTFDPSVVVDGTQTITYTIPGSCPSTDTQDITVYAVYDGTITPVGPFCQADLPITMTAASSGGTWGGTGINSASTGSFGSASLAANTYTITYSTQGNCSLPYTTTVVVNANVDATISAVADLCNDAPAINLTAADAGGTWSGQGVSATGTFTPNSVTPNTYTITYTIGGACPDSDTQDIVVLTVPDGTITPAGPFCQDALPQTLTAASTGGVWSGTGITGAANGTFGASNTPAGNYSITYTTPGQCSQTFNQVVQVIENLNATIASAGPFCEDAAPYTLSAASAGGVWSGTGTIATNGQISPSLLGPGTYTFNYDINNSGCLSSDNVQVTINALPQPSFTASTTNGCSPLSVTFTNTSNPLGSNCVWYVNGSPAGNGNTHSEVFTGSACEDIGVMITDAAGCSQSITMTDLVCVNPNPSASFTWSPIEPMLGGTVSFENTSLGGLTYTWDINGQGASGEDVTYNVPSETEGDFLACLEVVGPGGCMDAQCYSVAVSNESFIFIPNSFSPDADGTNDVFAPVIAGLTSDFRYTLRIYNRWGDVIFETNDPLEVWTGNTHGGDHYAQADSYVYELTLQLRAGEPPLRKLGSLILIR
jgi:gliding motility-associated-like protein